MATTRFFSPEWAEAARAAWNAGPSEEVKDRKLQKYWDWIDDARNRTDAILGLAVDDLPGGEPDCLLLHLEKGVCTYVELVPRSEAEARTTYLLTGSYADWRDLMDGYDAGKTIMYRKLRLEHGELLDFFKGAYLWTESLACLQKIPTELGS
ncbi:MAG TPA: hypothetical protein VMT85_03775 [Thermoanaerobaculia bacterium]|nr:hypothetical protein [Thermoanaerobaculia bacterium]